MVIDRAFAGRSSNGTLQIHASSSFVGGLLMVVAVVKGWLDRRVTDVVGVERALKMPNAGWSLNMVNSTTAAILPIRFGNCQERLFAAIACRELMCSA